MHIVTERKRVLARMLNSQKLVNWGMLAADEAGVTSAEGEQPSARPGIVVLHKTN